MASVGKLGNLCLVLALGPGLGGCSEGGGESGGVGDGSHADGVEALEAGPDQELWRLPSFEVPPGTEIQNCYALPPLEHDLQVTRYFTRQGAGGHHLAYYRALTDRPVGEWQDCTSPESHATLVPVLAALNAPGDGSAHVTFPDGMALLVPAGTSLVAQVHYINVTDDPILTDDQALLSLVPEAERDTIIDLHTAPLAALGWMLEPGVETTVEFECEVPGALELVLMVPHMHELGRRYTLSMGAPEAMRSVIDIREWAPDMRDRPPLTEFTTGNISGVLAAGDRMRGSCTWFNDTDHAIGFPQEMCAGFGYYRTDDPTLTEFSCVD